MKHFILFAALSLSASAAYSAEACKINLVDKDKNIVKTFEGADSCQEPMKDCRKSMRDLSLEGAECLKVPAVPTTTTTTTPPKPEIPKPPKPEVPKPDAPKPEAPKPEAPKPPTTPPTTTTPPPTGPTTQPLPPTTGPSTRPLPPTTGPSTQPFPPTTGPSTRPLPPTTGPSTRPFPPTTGPSTQPFPPSTGPNTRPFPPTTQPYPQSRVCMGVDMVDTYNRFVRTYLIPGDNEICYESLKECRKESRLVRQYQGNDCQVRTSQQFPPQPIPQPLPNDARRGLMTNESVYLNNRLVTVAGMAMNGTYAIKTVDGWGNTSIQSNVQRESLAVATGCNLDLCVNDQLLRSNVGTAITIVGLTVDNRFVVKAVDGWGNTLISQLGREEIALTKGCISTQYAQICVGNQVIDQSNRYANIIGLQVDGRVILRSIDGWGNTVIRTNIDPMTLVITR